MSHGRALTNRAVRRPVHQASDGAGTNALAVDAAAPFVLEVEGGGQAPVLLLLGPEGAQLGLREPVVGGVRRPRRYCAVEQELRRTVLLSAKGLAALRLGLLQAEQGGLELPRLFLQRLPQ